MGLPDLFSRWFESRGWTPRPHQLALIELARQGKSALLIAPTGGGKTLAGFLPSLIELTERRLAGKDLAHNKGKGELHTLYISPLKALATDIRRNLETPIAEMELPVRAESRTGDTPQSRRLRQRERPPDLLMTTPESLALLLSYPDAAQFFASLRCVDHRRAACVRRPPSAAISWRSAWRALAALAPQARFVGLSATVADPPALARLPAPARRTRSRSSSGEPGAPARGRASSTPRSACPGAATWAITRCPRSTTSSASTRPRSCSSTRAPRPSWSSTGCGASTRTTWRSGCITARSPSSSAARSRRRWRRASCAPWSATSSLDLGIDWGDVDLVIQMGAPKGVSRLMQRIGRANHRLDEPSRAMIVPANRFEVLESLAALEAIEARELDGDPPRPACLDVLAQHIVGMRLRPADRPRRPLRRGAPRRSPIATCRARISTTRSTSSPPAAMRWRPTSAGTG